MNRKTVSYEGQIVFESVVLPSKFKRFPKVFQQDEACFIYMDKGPFKFRTPTRLLEIHQGQAVLWLNVEIILLNRSKTKVLLIR